MNRIIIVCIALLISNIIIAQVTVSAVSAPVSEINSSSFQKVIINLKNGKIIKGYGSFSYTNFMWINFLKEKPKEVSIKDWEGYNAKEISKLTFNDSLEMESVTYKGASNRYQLMWKIYSNNNIKLYTFPNRAKDAGVYLVLKNNDEKADFLNIRLKKSNKNISKKVAKIFKECPILYTKIKNGEYKDSYNDLIKILEFYNKNCVIE